MQALEFPEFKRIKSYDTLECSCEKINLSSSKKKITVCEICSEKNFLRKNSARFYEDNFNSSLNESN